MEPPRHVMAERLSALDGLRGVAALLVALFHFKHFGPWFEMPWLGGSGLFPKSYLWVDLFFVLSGYVLAHVYARNFHHGLPDWGQVRSFWWARFARVYPLHLAVLLLLVGLIATGVIRSGSWADGRCYGAGDLAASLSLMHAWGTTEGLCWNVPSWSISAEMAAYALFPWLVPIVMGTSRRWSPLIPIFCIGTLVALEETVGQGTLSLHYDFGALRCLPSFVLGIWIFREGTEPARWQRIMHGDVACLLAGSAVVLLMHHWAPDVLIVAAMALLIAGMAGNRGSLGRLFGTGPLAWLGAISYAVYMLHWPLLLVFAAVLEALFPGQEVPPGRMVQLLLYFLFFAVLLAVSSASYRWVEQPSRYWLRNVRPLSRLFQRV